MVDASVAAKWVVQEDHSANAERLLHWDARHAPDHWLAEAVNVVWSKVFRGELGADDAVERIGTLLRAPVIGLPIADLMPRAFAISVAQGVTVYDSLYVALAVELDAVFVTADQRLLRRLAGDDTLRKLAVWVGDVSA